MQPFIGALFDLPVGPHREAIYKQILSIICLLWQQSDDHERNQVSVNVTEKEECLHHPSHHLHLLNNQ